MLKTKQKYNLNSNNKLNLSVGLWIASSMAIGQRQWHFWGHDDEKSSPGSDVWIYESEQGDPQLWHTWLTLRTRTRTFTVVVPVIVLPLIQRPASGIHEEVGYCAHFKSKLLCNSSLHLLRRTFCFLKYCMKRTALNICEHQSRFFWRSIFLGRLFLLCLFPLACWKKISKIIIREILIWKLEMTFGKKLDASINEQIHIFQV